MLFNSFLDYIWFFYLTLNTNVGIILYIYLNFLCISSSNFKSKSTELKKKKKLTMFTLDYVMSNVNLYQNGLYPILLWTRRFHINLHQISYSLT